MEKLNINQWAEEDRPREKMMRQGADTLSNAELLAILIGSGSAKESAVDLMKHVLNDCNNHLNTLGKMPIHSLCNYNGIGEAKAISILAACELGKRRQLETAEERPDCGTATRIYNHMRPVMQDLDTEEFWILLMNQNYKLIKKMRVSHGGITEVAVDIRIILKEAILANATILAVCHNQQGGRPPDGEPAESMQGDAHPFPRPYHRDGWVLLQLSRGGTHLSVLQSGCRKWYFFSACNQVAKLFPYLCSQKTKK